MLSALGLRQYLMIGGGVALALFAAWSWRVNDLRAHYKVLWGAEKAAHAQTVANYRNAQEAAQTAFDAKIQAIQLRNKEANDEADKRFADLRDDYARRVRSIPKAAACHPDSAGMPSPDLSESGDGPRGDTVILDRSDALICAQNTARLVSVRSWAQSLGGE